MKHWSRADEVSEGKVTRLTANDFPLASASGAGYVHGYAGDNWDEVVWCMRVKLSTGRMHLNFHARDDLRYLTSFGQDGTRISK